MSVQESSFFLGGILTSIGRILPQFPKIFKPVVLPSGKIITLPKLPKIGKPSGGTKLLLGTGIAGGTVLGTELFLLQPEGQSTLDSLDSSIGKLGGIGSGLGEGLENVTDFFSSNPIILPLLIGLGIILVVKS